MMASLCIGMAALDGVGASKKQFRVQPGLQPCTATSVLPDGEAAMAETSSDKTAVTDHTVLAAGLVGRVSTVAAPTATTPGPVAAAAVASRPHGSRGHRGGQSNRRRQQSAQTLTRFERSVLQVERFERSLLRVGPSSQEQAGPVRAVSMQNWRTKLVGPPGATIPQWQYEQMEAVEQREKVAELALAAQSKGVAEAVLRAQWELQVDEGSPVLGSSTSYSDC